MEWHFNTKFWPETQYDPDFIAVKSDFELFCVSKSYAINRAMNIQALDYIESFLEKDEVEIYHYGLYPQKFDETHFICICSQ